MNTGGGLDQIEYDTRDGEIARRNVLFGLWAGQRMGLKGDAIEDYAWSVHLADRDTPGHDDVIAKVASDLASCGNPISDRQLRSYLQEMAMRASLDLAQTDPEAIMSRRR
ncbi:MAG: ATPase inhibitor subunit zeta [Bradyrhizobium sp.]|nr:ATPase inhibitor subunit zeta [Bradyrhizobium sp.]